MLSFAGQVKRSPRAGCLEGWMLETMILGVPFCDLGRKGKIGVQVHFGALGGLLGVLMQKLGRAGILCGGLVVGGRADGSGRWLQAGQDGELAVCGFLLAGASLTVECGLQRAGSGFVVHGLSCPVAGGIFLN